MTVRFGGAFAKWPRSVLVCRIGDHRPRLHDVRPVRPQRLLRKVDALAAAVGHTRCAQRLGEKKGAGLEQKIRPFLRVLLSFLHRRLAEPTSSPALLRPDLAAPAYSSPTSTSCCEACENRSNEEPGWHRLDLQALSRTGVAEQQQKQVSGPHDKVYVCVCV